MLQTTFSEGDVHVHMTLPTTSFIISLTHTLEVETSYIPTCQSSSWLLLGWRLRLSSLLGTCCTCTTRCLHTHTHIHMSYTQCHKTAKK